MHGGQFLYWDLHGRHSKVTAGSGSLQHSKVTAGSGSPQHCKVTAGGTQQEKAVGDRARKVIDKMATRLLMKSYW